MTPEDECRVKKVGTDTYIGDYYAAPCGWHTYNRQDISHWKWHQLYAKSELTKQEVCDDN